MGEGAGDKWGKKFPARAEAVNCHASPVNKCGSLPEEGKGGRRVPSVLVLVPVLVPVLVEEVNDFIL